MTDHLVERLYEAIHASELHYYRLVLLVGKPESGKTTLLNQVAQRTATSVANVNLLLSRTLLALSMKQRAVKTVELVERIVDEMSSPLLLDNTELLFSADLRIDPLRLFQRISRNKAVVVAWNGHYDDKRLQYAEPGHVEHRTYDSVDATIIKMEEA